VNRDVQRAGDAARRFVIAVDDPDSCTAYGAATLERGGVTIAFSSSGRAPSLVTLLRRAVDAILPTELEAWRLTAESLRARLKAEGVPLSHRTPLLLSALNALHEEKPRAWSETATVQNGASI
jgi:siroheme synthase-like protein